MKKSYNNLNFSNHTVTNTEGIKRNKKTRFRILTLTTSAKEFITLVHALYSDCEYIFIRNGV